MPLVGFYCRKDGSPQPFSYCLGACGECPDLPFLYAITSDIRIPQYRTFSVTEIAKPFHQMHLQRTVDYYVQPEDLAIAAFGQAFHLLMSNTAEPMRKDGHTQFTFEDDLAFEARLVLDEFGEVKFKGRPDQWDDRRKVLTDYKTLKYFYEVMFLVQKRWGESKHVRQLNTYRVFTGLDCRAMELAVLIKDYSQELKSHGIRPFMIFEIPRIDDSEIKEYVNTRIKTYLTCEKYENFPVCSKDERFYQEKTRKSLNCEFYCDVRYICPYRDQFVGPAETSTNSLPKTLLESAGPLKSRGARRVKGRR